MRITKPSINSDQATLNELLFEVVDVVNEMHDTTAYQAGVRDAREALLNKLEAALPEKTEYKKEWITREGYSYEYHMANGRNQAITALRKRIEELMTNPNQP